MKKRIFLSVLLVWPCLVRAQQVTPIDSVRNIKTIVAYGTPVSNIVVTESGDLSVTSMETVTICAPFAVMLGGELNISILLPKPIVLEYDNSGNRIVRKMDE